MFEELCRKEGMLLIPTGKYEDSCPQYEEIPVTYFSMDKTFRTSKSRTGKIIFSFSQRGGNE